MNSIRNFVPGRVAFLGLLAALAVPSLAHASGLGNMTYTAAEVMKPVSNFGGTGAFKWPTGPTGSNTAVMIHQKLVIMGSLDSGKPPGSLHVYDVTNPRSPVLQKTLDGTPATSKLRELHAMPVAMPDGKTLIVLPTTSGIQFFDFTDPLNPAPAGTCDLVGANGGDYDNTVWMLSWEWPYVFAGGTGNGIFVVDATDPAACKVLPKIATGAIGGFRIGPTYAAGNFLIGMNMDQVGTQVAVIDVGDPSKPGLLASGRTPASLYSALVVGDRIYGPGTNGDYVMMSWDANTVSVVATGKSGTDRGGYCTFQSPFAICGQSSEGFKKWDTSNNKLTFVGTGTDPNGAGGDFDFATIMGNLVYLGNDHGSGSALIPHQMGMDTVAPAVVKVYPSEAKQPLTTRATIFFTEDIDLDTVNATNIIVRAVGGAVVQGVFSRSSFNAISFGPKAPLAANTTYEIVVPAGGVADLVGNKIGSASTVRFSTGPTIDTTGMTGGAGAGAGGSSSSAGGSTSSGGSTTAAGGSTSSGGSTASGGASSIGGSPATVVGGAGGGAPSDSGGATATATAGAPSSAGAVSGTPTTGASDKGGCSCSMPGGAAPTGLLAFGLGAACIGLGRLRGRNRRRSGEKQA